MNLLVFGAGERVAAHVNPEVDVLLVGVSESGTVVIEDASFAVVAGTLLLFPRGVRRDLRGGREGFAYLTCHRLRATLHSADR